MEVELTMTAAALHSSGRAEEDAGYDEIDPEPLLGHSLAEIEKAVILATLEHTDGDKRAAADILGISLRTVYNRLNDYAAADNE